MMNKITVILVLLVLAIATQGQRASRNYIARYTPIADSIWRKYGIPPSVTLGIALVETGGGTSALCKKFNNHFGLKGENTNSIKKLGRRTSYKEYHSYKESYSHFTRILLKMKYYRKLKGNTDSKLWLKALKKYGYASNPNWEAHVYRLIVRFGLHKLDARKIKKSYVHVPNFIKYRTIHRPLWE